MDPVETNHFFRTVLCEQQIPPNYTVVNTETNARYFMLLRPQEESTEIETYLNPLFSNYPDVFLQPVQADNVIKEYLVEEETG